MKGDDVAERLLEFLAHSQFPVPGSPVRLHVRLTHMSPPGGAFQSIAELVAVAVPVRLNRITPDSSVKK